MTANAIDRGGRPRQFDEDELIARIGGDEDLVLIEAALREHTSHPTWAAGCVVWLWRKRAGDPLGGKHPESATRYRRMLAELPFDPLKPPGGRRRALREAAQRGSAQFVVMSGTALASVVALAILSPSVALRLVGGVSADNARDLAPEAGRDDSGGVVVPLRRLHADGVPECVLGARCVPPSTRVECALEAIAA